MADVLSQAIRYQAARQTPLELMWQKRQDLEDRAYEQGLQGLNAADKISNIASRNVETAVKQRDLRDRENLTPLYEQWSTAPQGKAGDTQRQQALQSIGAIDPAKAQELQKGQQESEDLRLTMLKKIDDMSDTKRERAQNEAAQLAAKAQWAKEGGPDRWKQAFPDVPFEDADKVIAKGKVVKGVFDFYQQAKDKMTAVESEARFYAKELNIPMKEAIEYRNAQNDAQLRTSILNSLTVSGEYSPDQIPAELERRYNLVKRYKAQGGAGGNVAPSDDPLGLGM